jgi:hypothetical protein
MASPRSTASGRGAAPKGDDHGCWGPAAASAGRSHRRRRSPGLQATKASVSRGPPRSDATPARGRSWPGQSRRKGRRPPAPAFAEGAHHPLGRATEWGITGHRLDGIERLRPAHQSGG